MKNIFTLFLLLSAINVFSQNFFISDEVGDVYSFDRQNCETELVFDGQTLFSDIAFHPNGKFYGLFSNGDLIEVDTLNGTTEVIHTFSELNINSLAISSDGIIYSMGLAGRLWSYEIATGIETDNGSTLFSAQGDLAFYNGNLYMSAFEGLVLINFDDILNSSLVIDDELPGLAYGLVTIANDCDELEMFIIVTGLTGNPDIISALYKINFDTNSYEYICDFSKAVLGAASDLEYLASSPLQIENIDTTKATCGLSDGTITVFSTGGFGEVKYSINGIDFENGNVFSNLSAGVYTISILDESGCIKTQSVGLECDGIMQSISPLSNAELIFQLYPNPATSEIIISSKDLEINQIKIFSPSMKEMSVDIQFSNNNATINITKLPKGMYYVIVDGYFKKFIKM